MTGKTAYFILKKKPFQNSFLLNFLIFVWAKTLLIFSVIQGRSDCTSSVAFKVLIINCQIYFINSFIFNCLTLNIKLFIFKLFDVKFLFSENHVFRKQKKTAVYGVMSARPQILILNSLGKMMTCNLREINKFLRYHTKSILKCGFPTKGIKLTRLYFLRYWEYLSFETLGLDHFGRFGTKIFKIQLRLWNKKYQRVW